MKTWIMELCPEIQEWQAEIIAEHTQKMVEDERKACAKVCYREAAFVPDPIDRERIYLCADKIRARGNT